MKYYFVLLAALFSHIQPSSPWTIFLPFQMRLLLALKRKSARFRTVCPLPRRRPFLFRRSLAMERRTPLGPFLSEIGDDYGNYNLDEWFSTLQRHEMIRI
jgi:hypothetical protein